MILIERGNCTFVTKSRNVEQIGANALIIGDNKANENVTNLVLSDDGNGNSISIPTFMVRKRTYDLFAKVVENKDSDEQNKLIVKVDLQMTTIKNGRLTLTIWISSLFDFTPEMLESLGEFLPKMASDVDFEFKILSNICSGIHCKLGFSQ